MALFQGTIRSACLNMDTRINVSLPYESLPDEGGREYRKTLILLHGMKQNADSWVRMSRVERFASQYGYAIAMPEVQNSWYAPQPYAVDYFQYISKELPEVLHRVFGLLTDRDHLVVGGLSMGGFGAFLCALTYPERFSAAMGFSGAYIFHEKDGSPVSWAEECAHLIGKDGRTLKEYDIEALLEKTAGSSFKPRAYIACGRSDDCYSSYKQMRDELTRYRYDAVFDEWEGAHDWTFWDAALLHGIRWLEGLSEK